MTIGEICGKFPTKGTTETKEAHVPLFIQTVKKAEDEQSQSRPKARRESTPKKPHSFFSFFVESLTTFLSRWIFQQRKGKSPSIVIFCNSKKESLTPLSLSGFFFLVERKLIFHRASLGSDFRTPHGDAEGNLLQRSARHDAWVRSNVVGSSSDDERRTSQEFVEYL